MRQTTQKSAASGELCARCLQSVPLNRTRCPNCGEKHRSFVRRVVLTAAIFLLSVLAIAITVARHFAADPSQMPPVSQASGS